MRLVSAPIAVVLAPHDPSWAELAEREAARLSTALEAIVVRVHHVGSTSIPGIRAKPILDLVPIVHRVEALDDARERLESLGYDWWGEHGLPGRRFVTRDEPRGVRRVHLHAYEDGSREITRHLAFRDYLRAHPDVARAYDAEKQRARTLHPFDSHAYSNEKGAFIRRIEADALRWVGR